MRLHTHSQQESDHCSVHSGGSSPESQCSGEGWDMEAYIKALSTHHDFEAYVKRLKLSYKQEISDLRRDVAGRLEEIKHTKDDMVSKLNEHEVILQESTA